MTTKTTAAVTPQQHWAAVVRVMDALARLQDGTATEADAAATRAWMAAQVAEHGSPEAAVANLRKHGRVALRSLVLAQAAA